MNYFQALAAERRVRCELIAARVRSMGYACDWKKVNRHFDWFLRWEQGGLAFGYVIGRANLHETRQEGETQSGTEMDV